MSQCIICDRCSKDLSKPSVYRLTLAAEPYGLAPAQHFCDTTCLRLWANSLGSDVGFLDVASSRKSELYLSYLEFGRLVGKLGSAGAVLVWLHTYDAVLSRTPASALESGVSLANLWHLLSMEGCA